MNSFILFITSSNESPFMPRKPNTVLPSGGRLMTSPGLTMIRKNATIGSS
jgi:hypothetical protein